ncbi:MAG TPA: D-glucuronyl C5-epimerase family protein [Acidobacteriota bacterium]|nr:D-glucuronyl C5-epimerase family protein [Acidobacteriota bacterium]
MRSQTISKSILRVKWWLSDLPKAAGCISKELDIQYPLPYYFEPVWAERNLTFDERGIKVCRLNGKIEYSPTQIFDFGIRAYQKHLREGGSYWKKRWLLHANWALENQVRGGAKEGGWIFDFPLPDVGAEPGFLDASAQGLAMSLLTRTWIATGDDCYAEAARKAVIPFTRSTEDGGVCTEFGDGHRFFETYPSASPNYVLVGHMRAILGLRDMSIFMDDRRACGLMTDGLETLKMMLPMYDSGFWSRYSLRKGFPHISCLTYHLNAIDCLRVIHMFTGEDVYKQYADRFAGYASSRRCNIKAIAAKTLWRLPRLHLFH